MKDKIFDYVQRLWYATLSIIASISFQFYFKRWQIANYKNVPKNGPTIYASNHQNAFLDAIAIILSNKRHPVFLTRADIFKSKTANFWLRSFNMIPIYRIRDGKESIAKNDEVIKECVKILGNGRQPLAIFPEGNHMMHRSLRPFKKGVGRIAFAAMEDHNFNLDLKIVPIGINYSRPTRLRGDLLVNFGKPIVVKDYVELYKQNPNAAYLALKDELSLRIKELIIDIHDNVNYEAIERIWAYEKQPQDNMLEELHTDQEKVELLIKEAEDGTLMDHINQPRKIPKSWLKMILGFPFFIYGALNHLLSHFVIDRIISKVVSDIHFYGSVKVATAMFLVPIIYLLQTWGVYAISGNWLLALFYLITLPFFGVYSYDYKDKYIQGTPLVEPTSKHFKS